MSLPEQPRPENWADLSPRQQAEWLLEPIGDELSELYVLIISKGLKLPADIVKHFTNDEWTLGIETFFSVGAKRAANAARMQAVITQIALERMTEPEQRRAASYALRHWPIPVESESPTEQPPSKPKRKPRAKPSKLAKWEAQWRAEAEQQGAEAER